MNESKRNTSNLFQSLYGLTEINNREVRVCLVVSLIISLGVTVAGGIVEFEPDNFQPVKWLLATIEHFSNALPFSIFLCLVVLVIVDRIREIKMRSDRIRQEIRNEGRDEGKQEAYNECREWYENGRQEDAPWEMQGDSSAGQSAHRERPNKRK